MMQRQTLVNYLFCLIHKDHAFNILVQGIKGGRSTYIPFDGPWAYYWMGLTRYTYIHVIGAARWPPPHEYSINIFLSEWTIDSICLMNLDSDKMLYILL